jgi:hypothetical protein
MALILFNESMQIQGMVLRPVAEFCTIYMLNSEVSLVDLHEVSCKASLQKFALNSCLGLCLVFC